MHVELDSAVTKQAERPGKGSPLRWGALLRSGTRYAAMMRAPCLVLVVVLGVGGCSLPSAAPPVPSSEVDPTPPAQDPAAWGDVEIGRVDGQPVPDGSMLLLRQLRVSCLPGPDPALDNEDPAAQAEERWLLRLDTMGWASVTHGVRVFLWDGVADPTSGRHRLAFGAGVSMSQIPAGQSADPYEYDEWSLAIPVLSDSSSAASVDGSTLGCSDDGGGVSSSHDVMVCAMDARDLETVSCWFCGTHLGQSASPAPDTVGRVSSAPGPGGDSFSVTDVVDCVYGEPSGARSGQ